MRRNSERLAEQYAMTEFSVVNNEAGSPEQVHGDLPTGRALEDLELPLEAGSSNIEHILQGSRFRATPLAERFAARYFIWLAFLRRLISSDEFRWAVSEYRRTIAHKLGMSEVGSFATAARRGAVSARTEHFHSCDDVIQAVLKRR